MKTFKIGDKVKIINTASGSAKKLFGQIGKVIKVQTGNWDTCRENGGGYVVLDIEQKLPEGPGGIWFDDIQLVDRGKLDLSHIKLYGVAKFINSLEKT